MGDDVPLLDDHSLLREIAALRAAVAHLALGHDHDGLAHLVMVGAVLLVRNLLASGDPDLLPGHLAPLVQQLVFVRAAAVFPCGCWL